MTLLVVEDNENKRWLLAHYIARGIENADCVMCASGAEAIQQLRLQPADAIVTDHSMQPVNGIELIKWVRAQGLKIPIIMVTAYLGIEEEALMAGATLVLNTYRFSEIAEYLAPMLGKAEEPVN
jgi:two-component system response regulator AtoC